MHRLILVNQLALKLRIPVEEAQRVVDALFDPGHGLLAGDPAEGPLRVTGFQRPGAARGHVGPEVEFEVLMREPGWVEEGIVAVPDADDNAVIAIEIEVPSWPSSSPGASSDPGAVERAPGDDVSRGFGRETERPAGDIGGAAMDVHGSGSGGRE